MPATPKNLFKGSILLGSAPTKVYVSNTAIVSNLATITTNAAHGMAVGDIVTIQGANATIDGTYVVYTVPLSTTFTFVSTTATLASAATSPVGVATVNLAASGQTVTNRVISNGITTITTGSAHGLAVNDTVSVTIGLASVDTMNAKVIAVPSATTFCYVSSTTTLATAAVSQGFFTKQTSPLYTVPASTTTIVSNLIVTNESASSATFSLALNGNRMAEGQTIAANSSAYFDIKQTLDTTQTITGGASSPFVLLSASGVEIS
jgi:hypothetical protein